MVKFTRYGIHKNGCNLSDEDFYIIREKDIITVSSMSKEVIFMYETFILQDDDPEEGKKKLKTDPDNALGMSERLIKQENCLKRSLKNKPSNS